MPAACRSSSRQKCGEVHKQSCLAGTVSGAVPRQQCGAPVSPLLPPSESSSSFPLPRDCSQEAAAESEHTTRARCLPSGSLLPSQVSCSSRVCATARQTVRPHNTPAPSKEVTQRRIRSCPFQNQAGLEFNSWQAGAPPHPPPISPSSLY